MIPYKLFILLLSGLDAIDSIYELSAARAVSLGYGLAQNGTDARVRSAARALTRRAFPSG